MSSRKHTPEHKHSKPQLGPHKDVRTAEQLSSPMISVEKMCNGKTDRTVQIVQMRLAVRPNFEQTSTNSNKI